MSSDLPLNLVSVEDIADELRRRKYNFVFAVQTPSESTDVGCIRSFTSHSGGYAAVGLATAFADGLRSYYASNLTPDDEGDWE